MAFQLEPASDADAPAIAAVRLAAARDLTARFGRGTWTFAVETVEGVRLDLRAARIFIARHEGVVVATLRLSEKCPWIGDTPWFTPCSRPIYLTSMAVSPGHQRRGIGRQCLADVMRVAREWPADAVRLDSYNLPAGAVGFYQRCGFREVARADYNGIPLVWFERVVLPRET